LFRVVVLIAKPTLTARVKGEHFQSSRYRICEILLALFSSEHLEFGSNALQGTVDNSSTK
jgi:hypothetical protein